MTVNEIVSTIREYDKDVAMMVRINTESFHDDTIGNKYFSNNLRGMFNWESAILPNIDNKIKFWSEQNQIFISYLTGKNDGNRNSNN